MCGIVGIVSPHQAVQPLTERIRSMQQALHHRGPDGMGHFVAPGIALGHTRLAIIDVSSSGQQPMTNEDGTLHLIINGEIYNYRELKAELQSQGHAFRSQSDSEVVLHLYEEFGDDCVTHLDGMFAFALWDSRQQRLLLARDRFGIKPLYFLKNDHCFLFASELTALLGQVDGMGDIDRDALYAYLTFSYVPAQMSILKGIQKVFPAERLIWKNNHCNRQIYWEPAPSPFTGSHSEATEAVAELLEQSVHSQLVSDVPIAAFLSGGVDSSTIVAMAQRHTQLQTFCVSFKESECDESPIARTISTHLGTDHQEVSISLDPVSLLFQALEYMDEPFADSSALPTFAVSQAARQVAKVVLSGDGGDEVFGGYTGRYRVSALQALIPKPGIVAQCIRLLPPWRSGRRQSLPEMLEQASLSDSERFVSGRQITTPSQRAALFGLGEHSEKEWRLRDIPQASIHQASKWHPVHRALWMDLTTSLPNDMLTKVDRMSMAHGLEVRVPFLNHRLVELALSLPPHWLVSAKPVEGKRILRDVANPLMPSGILERPKQGFCIPLNRWIVNHYFRLFDEICLGTDSKIREFFPHKVLQEIRNEPIAQKGREDVYALLVLELWLRKHQHFKHHQGHLSESYVPEVHSGFVSTS